MFLHILRNNDEKSSLCAIIRDSFISLNCFQKNFFITPETNES